MRKTFKHFFFVKRENNIATSEEDHFSTKLSEYIPAYLFSSFHLFSGYYHNVCYKKKEFYFNIAIKIKDVVECLLWKTEPANLYLPVDKQSKLALFISKGYIIKKSGEILLILAVKSEDVQKQNLIDIPEHQFVLFLSTELFENKVYKSLLKVIQNDYIPNFIKEGVKIIIDRPEKIENLVFPKVGTFMDTSILENESLLSDLIFEENVLF
jgi:hypothetical protein